MNDCERKTIAVCTRMLPIGCTDTVYRTLSDDVTIGEVNKWCDTVCSGNAVCVRLELVDQWQG